jgi:surfeit locus 1 family protein
MSSGAPGTVRLMLRPSMFLLHVPAVLAVGLAVALGQWQLGAWQLHREDQAAELADADPLPLDDVLGPDDPFPSAGLGQPVEVEGTWVPEATTYVVGREPAPESDATGSGYWMVTPLSTCGAQPAGCADPAAIPVVLGWAPSPEAAPDPPTGRAEVLGWLQPGEGSGDPEDQQAAASRDDVLATLRVAELLQRMDQDLYGGYVILRSPAALQDGLEPVTPDSLPEAPTFTALRNLLYGIEWWAFAGFAVFLWWRWTRDEVRRIREREAVRPVSTDAEPAPEAPAARIPSEP